MKKTSIYIEPEGDVALARRAAAEGTTEAELIRHRLRDHYVSFSPPTS